MRYVVELGHSHIGIIGLPDGVHLAADQRLLGMRAQARQHRIDFDALPRINGTFSSESGAVAAAALLEACPDLTALIALNDRMAMGAIHHLQEMGRRVPDEISVVGYDDLPQSHEFNPPLTTINQQLSEWGTLAMTMLLELLDGQEPEPLVLEPKLVVRKSTAPASARTARPRK
jgi:LacI family transcriptional regulator